MLLVLVALIYGGLAWFLVRRGTPREAAAFLLAPLAPGVLGAAQAQEPLLLLIATPFSFLFALPAIPFFFLYRRLGWTHFWNIIPLSTLLGALSALPMNAVSFYGGLHVTNEKNLLMLMAYGALVGTVFWLVAYAQIPRKARLSSSVGP